MGQAKTRELLVDPLLECNNVFLRENKAKRHFKSRYSLHLLLRMWGHESGYDPDFYKHYTNPKYIRKYHKYHAKIMESILLEFYKQKNINVHLSITTFNNKNSVHVCYDNPYYHLNYTSQSIRDYS